MVLERVQRSVIEVETHASWSNTNCFFLSILPCNQGGGAVLRYTFSTIQRTVLSAIV